MLQQHIDYLKKLENGINEDMEWNRSAPDLVRAGTVAFQKIQPLVADGQIDVTKLKEFDLAMSDIRAILRRLDRQRQEIRTPGDPQF